MADDYWTQVSFDKTSKSIFRRHLTRDEALTHLRAEAEKTVRTGLRTIELLDDDPGAVQVTWWNGWRQMPGPDEAAS